MPRIDLHTHSQASPDGGLTARDYRKMLKTGGLDYIAVTDHNTTDFARELQTELGDAIIIGEEITTTEGEMIGLYLNATIPGGLSPASTVAAIRKQGGLVYIPHPFETVRSGMTPAALERIAADVDIIEIHNGRAVFQNRSTVARDWQERHDRPGVASSDAHAAAGWGATYTIIEEAPSRATLVDLLYGATYQVGFPGVRAVLSPKFNRLKKKLRRA